MLQTLAVAEVYAWQQTRANRERKATHRREKREKMLWIAVAVLAFALNIATYILDSWDAAESSVKGV